MAKNTEVLVALTATALPAGADQRRTVMIHNYGPNAIHVGFASTIAAAKGMKIAAGASLGPLSLDQTVGLWALAETAAQLAGAATIVSEW